MRMRIVYGAVLLLPLFASAQKQQPPIPAIGESIDEDEIDDLVGPRERKREQDGDHRRAG